MLEELLMKNNNNVYVTIIEFTNKVANGEIILSTYDVELLMNLLKRENNLGYIIRVSIFCDLNYSRYQDLFHFIVNKDVVEAYDYLNYMNFFGKSINYEDAKILIDKCNMENNTIIPELIDKMYNQRTR